MSKLSLWRAPAFAACLLCLLAVSGQAASGLVLELGLTEDPDPITLEVSVANTLAKPASGTIEAIFPGEDGQKLVVTVPFQVSGNHILNLTIPFPLGTITDDINPQSMSQIKVRIIDDANPYGRER